jgi:hypothetical protein
LVADIRRRTLGHADAAMTAHYTHIEAEAHKAAAEAVAKLVERRTIVNACSHKVPILAGNGRHRPLTRSAGSPFIWRCCW